MVKFTEQERCPRLFPTKQGVLANPAHTPPLVIQGLPDQGVVSSSHRQYT